MPELIKVVRREASAPPVERDPASAGGEPLPAAPAHASAARQALRDAWSLLPSLDATKNERFKLGLLLGWGMPVWYALATTLLLATTTVRTPLLPALAAFLVASLVGPIATLFLTALPVTFAFYAFQGEDTRSRLRQALVCPYCRDEVGREGTVICARKKCGALYHRECWEECAQQYGGCAVYGCSSKKSREITLAGFVLRFAKLVVAAALFPPRAVRAIRNAETESALSVYRRAVEASRRVYWWTNRDSGRQFVFVLLLGVPLSYAVAVPLIWAAQRNHDDARFLLPAFLSLIGVPFLMLALPYLLAIPVVFTLYFARAVKRALESEFSALERADQGGGTVLGRIAAGFGAKKE